MRTHPDHRRGGGRRRWRGTLGVGLLLLAGCGMGTRDAGAQFTRGQAAETGGSYTAAARWYRRAATQGHPGAQFALGSLYETGTGVPLDYETMMRWMHAAAAQGQRDAQFTLGVVYTGAFMWGPNWSEIRKSRVRSWYWRMRWRLRGRRGWGAQRDKAHAYMWFSLAAARGHPGAPQYLKLLELGMTPDERTDADRRLAAWRPVQQTIRP